MARSNIMARSKKERLEEFGKELRLRREAAGIDQKVLALRIGISPQHLSQVETAYDKGGRGPVGLSDEAINAVSAELEWRVVDIRRILGQIPDEEFEEFAEDEGEHPAISYLRRQPDPVKDRALRIMEAALPPAEAESPGAAQQKATQKAALVTRADNLSRDLRAGRPGLSRTPAVVWALDKNGRFLMSGGNGLPDAGLAPGQVVGLHIWDVYKDVPEFLEKVRLVLASDGPLEWSAEVRGQRYLCKTEPLRNEGGEKIGIVGASLSSSGQWGMAVFG